MNGDEAQTNPLPPGFDDVEPLALTGCGQVYRARVSTVEGHVEQVAVTLVDTPVRGRDAKRLRSDCLSAVAINAEPGVLAVRDLGFTKDHRPFLVTDTILPGTLATRIEQQGALPPGEVVTLGLTLARALQAAHRNGILHLGVAPDAVFPTPEGPALGHFGLAWAVRPPSQPDVPATAIMHAPRELFGWAGPTVGSDVYGLASVLRTALAGRAPFETEARTSRAALYHRLVQGAPPKLHHPGVPDQMTTLLDRMMDPDAARRPALDEVTRTLEAVAQIPGLMAARPAPAPQPTVQLQPQPQPIAQAPTVALIGQQPIPQAPQGFPQPVGPQVQGPSPMPPQPVAAPQPQNPPAPAPQGLPAPSNIPAPTPPQPVAAQQPQDRAPQNLPTPQGLPVPPNIPAPQVQSPAPIPPQPVVAQQPQGLAPQNPPAPQGLPVPAGASAPQSVPAPAPHGLPAPPNIPAPQVQSPAPIPPQPVVTQQQSLPAPAPHGLPVPPNIPAPQVQSPAPPPPGHFLDLPPFADRGRPTGFPAPRPTPPPIAATTPAPKPVEPRRRNTGLVLLVAAGVTALAAGVAWGVATSPKKATSASTNSPVVSVPTFSGAQRSAYEVTDAKASAAGDGVTVTWSAPRQTTGVQSYIVVVNLHNQSVQSTTVAGQTLTATFKGLTPGTTYCVSVVTFAVAPGDAGPHTAPPEECALVTTSGPGSPASPGGPTTTRAA